MTLHQIFTKTAKLVVEDLSTVLLCRCSSHKYWTYVYSK